MYCEENEIYRQGFVAMKRKKALIFNIEQQNLSHRVNNDYFMIGSDRDSRRLRRAVVTHDTILNLQLK
jgi:hypothetical protein